MTSSTTLKKGFCKFFQEVSESGKSKTESDPITLALTYETGGIGGAEASKELAATATTAGAAVEALLVLPMFEMTLGFSVSSAFLF